MTTKREIREIIRKIIKEEVGTYGPDNLGHTKIKGYKQSLDDFIKSKIEEESMDESLTAVKFKMVGDAYKKDARKVALQLIKDYKIKKFNETAKEELVRQLKPRGKRGLKKIVLNVDTILRQQELGTF